MPLFKWVRFRPLKAARKWKTGIVSEIWPSEKGQVSSSNHPFFRGVGCKFHGRKSVYWWVLDEKLGFVECWWFFLRILPQGLNQHCFTPGTFLVLGYSGIPLVLLTQEVLHNMTRMRNQLMVLIYFQNMLVKFWPFSKNYRGKQVNLLNHRLSYQPKQCTKGKSLKTPWYVCTVLSLLYIGSWIVSWGNSRQIW